MISPDDYGGPPARPARALAAPNLALQREGALGARLQADPAHGAVDAARPSPPDRQARGGRPHVAGPDDGRQGHWRLERDPPGDRGALARAAADAGRLGGAT